MSSQFPSGQWAGFYTYAGHSKRFMMDLVLEFKDGKMMGEGAGGIGSFARDSMCLRRPFRTDQVWGVLPGTMCRANFRCRFATKFGDDVGGTFEMHSERGCHRFILALFWFSLNDHHRKRESHLLTLTLSPKGEREFAFCANARLTRLDSKIKNSVRDAPVAIVTQIVQLQAASGIIRESNFMAPSVIKRIFPVLLLLCGVLPIPARAGLPSFQQTGNVLLMSNGNVQVQYNLSAGTAAFLWQNSQKIAVFYSGVGLNTGYVKGINFSNRTWVVVSSNQVAVTAHAAGLPDMTQYFILDQNDSFLTRVTMSGANPSANWMGPVVVNWTGGVDLGITNDNRALFVPFDNDDFVSYNAESINGTDVGNEVGAFYDSVSRHGLVVGSVTHDTWKTGVYWSGSNYKLNLLNVYGGVTSKWTWDEMAHGFVTGSTISSPTIFVGFGNDWRQTMENFAAENARFVPPLVWTNDVPFGWNSWGVTNYESHLNYADAIAVSDSIHTNLQPDGFTNSGTVYVNLDSYWSNLSGAQLQSFVSHCHANGQKAGIYWGPFVYWGTLAQSSNQYVPGTSYFYSDILLRTTNGSAITTNEAAYAIDPTHPGTKQLINYQINVFTNDGFDFIKLDFLSHASREGVHYDTNVTTGIEAYNQGMQYLFNQIAGKMFISESIAPLFPYQYGHSRRIACDAYTSRISNTAYTMNAVSSGWWIDRLYPFNDPDMMVFDNGPDINEAQSRLINGAVTGLFLNGSILTNTASISLAQLCLTNAAINAVARAGQTFRPVDWPVGTGAANIFARQDGDTWCLAVFNYTSGATNETVDLGRAGLPSGTFAATNLWDGTVVVVTNSFTVSLNAKQAKLFRLALTSRPVFGAARWANGSGFVASGSNGIPGWTYCVLASTNLAWPVSQWPAIATNLFDANGDFSFTNQRGPNGAQFYLLRLQ